MASNPFLFGAPAAGGGMPPQQPAMQADNPFLSGAPSPQVMMQSPQVMMQSPPQVMMHHQHQQHHQQQQVNPFLSGAPSSPAPPTPQPQLGAFGQPMSATPPVAAANPFANFGAPMPQAPAGSANPFAVPTPAPVAAPTPPMSQFTSVPSTTMHQYQGTHGSYTQVTAGQHSQPVVCTASTGVPVDTSPFGVAAKTTAVGGGTDLTRVTNSSSAAPQLSLVSVTNSSEPPPPPPEPEPRLAVVTSQPEEVSKSVEEAALAPDVKFSQIVDEVPLPPPPPQEQEVAEAAAPVAVPEPAKQEDEPLPPPPPPEESELSQKVVGTPPTQEVEEKVKDMSLGQEPVKEDSSKTEEAASEMEESTGASLFGVNPNDVPSLPKEEEKPVPVVHYIAPVEEEPEKEKSPSPPPTIKMSTGDAIFADLPVTDVTSTGANIFGVSEESAVNTTGANIFDVSMPQAAQPVLGSMSGWDDAFDRKFDTASGSDGPTMSASGDPFDAFGGGGSAAMMSEAAGGGAFGVPSASSAFGAPDDGFGAGKFNPNAPSAALAADLNNPFLNEAKKSEAEGEDGDEVLFDDDTTLPLEPFPRLENKVDGWEFYIRYPPKKKLTAQRYWKKVHVRIVMQGDNPCVQLFENKDAKDAFQEVPLQATYSLSEVAHQVFDQYTKIFTLKLQFVSYKERAGIRPGQVSKLEKLTGKIGFLAKAVEDADLKGVKEFASDMKKLGIPMEHAPQVAELLKLGSDNFEDLKQFTVAVEEKLFRMNAIRDRSVTYKTEEVQLTAVDEVFVQQDKTGHVMKQLCRVRVFFLSFLSDMPDVELGVNDLERMGLEVVGRHDILPCPTEQWIRYENIEFHHIIDKKAFAKEDHIIKFRPPDAGYLELMRFRVRPPKCRELPMQARCMFQITGNKVEIRADMMIPYHHTKAWGQVPCEDVSMRIPLPECWIYQFRTEKAHLSLTQLATGNLNIGSRMGSVKSAHRRAGKVKGLERVLGTLESQKQELMETSSGEAKYEHQHKSIVWRVPRLPKHGQGSYTNHEFVCRLNLTGYDQMPEKFDKDFYVEFTQPATSVSHTVLRSVSIQGGSGEPPEKCVKYVSRHEYKLEIEFCEKETNTYMQAAKKKEPDPEPVAVPEVKEYTDFPDENGERKFSDSDSD